MNNWVINSLTNQILNKNPEARQLYNELKSKTPAELRQYAENVAQGKGVNLHQFLSNNFGITVQ